MRGGKKARNNTPNNNPNNNPNLFFPWKEKRGGWKESGEKKVEIIIPVVNLFPKEIINK